MTFKILAPLLAIVTLTAACTTEADQLTNGHGKKGKGTKTAGSSCTQDSDCESGSCDPTSKVCTADSVNAALECTAAPQGRSYVLFDGSKLEATRTNEATGVNRARVKPYAVMASEYQRVLGNTPDAIKTAGGSFDAPPERWFAEPAYDGVSMNAVFDISFAGCLTYTRAASDLTAMPTADSATAFCTSFQKKAWSRSPSPDEISACTDLATNKLSAEPDVAKRWAYVCASVLSSSQFLTF
jgi:hypothetical protein